MAKLTTDTFYYFGLGSNMGRRTDTLRRAIRLIDERISSITYCSPFIETEPWGYKSRHRYLNAAVAVITNRDPHEVLAITQQIERELGRTTKTRDGHYEDRPIDIDILICEHNVVYTSELRLPHPRMWQRAFVTECMAALRVMKRYPPEQDSPKDLAEAPDPKTEPANYHYPRFGRHLRFGELVYCSKADTEPRVATIGFFDGAHLGHHHLAQQLVELNKGRQHRAIMLTFDRHPHDVVHPDEPPVQQLTLLIEKRMAFFRYGNGLEMWFMHFGPDMAALTAREFMERVLRDQLNIDTLLIGYDHHFGRPLPGETFDDYVRYGQELGIRIVRATELPGEQHVSSSAIRRAILGGDFAKANAMLGKTYHWWGKVVHGDALGRKLGFPTANLEPCHPELIIPSRGVYAAWASIPGKPRMRLLDDGKPINFIWEGRVAGPTDKGFPAMVNIGTRPTITGNATDGNPQHATVEAHIIGLDDDIYGEEVGLTFVARLRDERQFASEDDLVRQLQADRDEVLRILMP